ncbi:MAG: amidase [Steroidobacteraceae bacterium]
MTGSRRDFFAAASAALLGSAASGRAAETPVPDSSAGSANAPPGSPPAFGTAVPVGPEVTAETFRQASKLVQIEFTDGELSEAASNWRDGLASIYERRTGPRRVVLEDSVAPYSQVSPVLPGWRRRTTADRFIRSGADVGELPSSDAAIAYAPVWKLSRWIESRRLSSERLTHIYLERIAKFDPQLHCVITLTAELALRQARQADKEIAAGKHRGPLHGIPWGGKDLLDTAGIATTYGAEPFRNRIPASDATVVSRLRDAGAVLIAKLSLGALALNDIWFGGQTMNPWLPEEGASGSSAGPGAATAAGLVGFAIGSETEGSIVSPSMRCGVTGLRPTFGRVPRTGAMTLCWSLDKLGPMARSVEDTMLVLKAISGPDSRDLGSVHSQIEFDVTSSVRNLRVGFFPEWMTSATEVDRSALEHVAMLGMMPVKISIPNWPYESLNAILFAESAAAFEELTLSHGIDQLRVQTPDAWPNTFRQSRFVSAVDLSRPIASVERLPS